MNTDTLLERVLNKIDDLSVAADETGADMKAVKDHLRTLNGSVARHEQSLNESILWRATHEQSCKPKISETTILKGIAMLCGTALTIFGAQITGFAEAIISLLK